MDWGKIAERFEEDDAAVDDSLSEYLVVREGDKQTSRDQRLTITGPRGSGKSAMLRVVESSCDCSWLVARATYAELRDLASALNEISTSQSPQEDLAKSVVFFWAIAVLASDATGLTHGETDEVRKAGLKVGFQDPDFIETVAQVVRENFSGALSAFVKALGIEVPLRGQQRSAGRAAARPFSVLQRVLPSVRKVLNQRKVLLQIDEIDGSHSELPRIASAAFHYVEALDRLCHRTSGTKWCICISSAVWAYIIKAGYNLKHTGRVLPMSPWSTSELADLWCTRLDPNGDAAASFWRELIPLIDDFETRASWAPEGADGPSVFGCRSRLRTFVNFWALIFRDAEARELDQIVSVPDSVWGQHVSHAKANVLAELASEVGDLSPVLQALGRTKKDTIDESSFASLLRRVAGRLKRSVEPWLTMTPRRLIELLTEAEVLIRLGDVPEWRVRKALII